MSQSNVSQSASEAANDNGEGSVDQLETNPKNETADVVESKANDRAFRDLFIEKEEARWNTEAKKTETIEKEKREMAHGLSERSKKIEEGIKNMKEPLKRVEDLPEFLRECGLDEKSVHGLEQSLPQNYEAVSPKNKHVVTAIFEAINQLFERDSFSEGSFMTLALNIFERERSSTFVADQTKYVKYEDRNGDGFYRSKEGEAFIRQRLADENRDEVDAAA